MNVNHLIQPSFYYGSLDHYTLYFWRISIGKKLEFSCYIFYPQEEPEQGFSFPTHPANELFIVKNIQKKRCKAN